jgi:ATP-binding cassette subfamily B protein
MRDKTNRGARPRMGRQTLQLYFAQIGPKRGYFHLGYLTSAVFVVANDILTPLYLGFLVDELIAIDRSAIRVNKLLWLIVIIQIVAFAMARITFWFRNRVLTTTERNLNMLVFDTYGRQEYSYFTNNFVGSLVARAQRFTGTFKDLYDMSLFALLNMVIQLFGPMIILTHRAPILTVIFLTAAIATLLTIKFTGKKKGQILRANSAASSRLTGELADSLTNNLAIKVFGSFGSERKRFYSAAEHRREAYLHQALTSEKYRIVRSAVSVGFFLATTIALVRLSLSNAITIGTVILVQLYLIRLEQSLWDLNRLVERVEESLADSAEMTEVVLRQPLVNDVATPINLEIAKGDISFVDVNFRYHDANKDDILFRHLSLSIPAGQKVGLVGPSGGGKTTLTKLLLRFMDIQSGAITIDGQDITQAKQNDVRSSIAYVPQEPLLFHRSIKENIAYGDPSASEDEIIKAAKLAHAHDFIAKLPQGYDTLVGERGVKLSGGEKQRVAIARAMLKKSPIVVLDEATSALDSKSEKAIVAALDNLMAGRTTIVIAHRLSTIRKLDRIVVLKDGKIVEDGTHAELLKENGLYAELWSHQSGEFLPEE